MLRCVGYVETEDCSSNIGLRQCKSDLELSHLCTFPSLIVLISVLNGRKEGAMEDLLFFVLNSFLAVFTDFNKPFFLFFLSLRFVVLKKIKQKYV